MKIVLIQGAMPNYNAELSRVLKIITDTLTELEVDIESINLAYAQVPYFDGIDAKSAENIMRYVEAADGIIFATTAMLYGMSSVMSTFLEYFSLSEYEEILNNKNCMTVVTSYAADERHVLETFSRLLNRLGAFDQIKIGMSSLLTNTLDNEATREIIIRQVEDFYRIVRQNRRFFVLNEAAHFRPPTVMTPIEGLSRNQYDTLHRVEERQKLDISEIYEKLNLHSMTSKQEKDIDDITQIITKRISEAPEYTPNPILNAPLIPRPAQVSPRVKTCRQMVQSMPHYFQPQLAAGISCIIQLSISGSETFEAHIEIVNSECRYIEGKAAAPDLTILADASVWIDVLNGKYTAQKAFMIGKLKVRGNFVTLTKFEQLFKAMS